MKNREEIKQTVYCTEAFKIQLNVAREKNCEEPGSQSQEIGNLSRDQPLVIFCQNVPGPEFACFLSSHKPGFFGEKMEDSAALVLDFITLFSYTQYKNYSTY